MSTVLVYMTASSADEAGKIGSLLLEKRLAACVNIIPAISSMYWWEGKIQSDQEAVVIAKTQESLVEELVAAVKAAHSYDCPCIVNLPITGGNPAFLEWIRRETSRQEQ
ncbi:MAG: divalent-cation tolerance protein CutA [Verrucomicrobia bacterium]|nr:divalent-cation tolerance protein CutA [Verrucomicrobiota bacterium]